MYLQGAGRDGDWETHTLQLLKNIAKVFCVLLGKPLQFSESQLSTYRNEQLEELFLRSLLADKCSSALFFSILQRRLLKSIFFSLFVLFFLPFS